VNRDRARVAIVLGASGHNRFPTASALPRDGAVYLAGGNHNEGSPAFRGFRLSVICVGQTYKLPGFKDPARGMPTPPSEYIPLRAALRRRRPAYFFAAGWQSGMKGNSATALRG
jgi:hypothetical protein